MRGVFACWLVAVTACAAEGDVTLDGTSLTTDEETPVSFTLAVHDPRGRVVQPRASKPAHGVVAIDGLLVTYTPDKDYAGADQFDVFVEDDEPPSATAQIEVTVMPVDDAPVATNDHFAATEDLPFIEPFTWFLANDVDADGDTLTVTAVGAATNGSVSISAPNVITFVPAANYNGIGSFEYTMSDGKTSSTATVTLSIGMLNDAPVAVDDARTMVEDTQADFLLAPLTANDTDVDNQTLVVASVGNFVNCWLYSPTVNTVRVIPNRDFTGIASFEYTVSDGTLTSTAVVNVTVTPVNDAPKAQWDTATVQEDSSVDIVLASLANNDIDVDGDALTVVGADDPQNGTLSVSNGVARFTPNSDLTGYASFAYTVSDGQLMTSGRVELTVQNVNDGPSATDDTAMTNEDSSVTLFGWNLVQNDVDIDNKWSLAITGVGNFVNGTASFDGSYITFRPSLNFHGTASFDYTVSDGMFTDTATVTVSVASQYDQPEAISDEILGLEDASVQFSVSQLAANDKRDDGLSMTVTNIFPPNPNNGSMTVIGDIATYTPPPNFNGNAWFSYTVSDGTMQVTGFSYIRVQPVNDPPVARDDTYLTDEDTPLNISSFSLRSNDSDIDFDFLQTTAVGNPTNGTVTLVNGLVTFTPTRNFAGVASFEYTVSDQNLTDTGTAFVVVKAVDDAPIAGDDSAATPTNTTLVLPNATLLANDNDVDGPALSITGAQAAVHGSVSFESSTVTFVPETGFAGTASFEYTVSDGTFTDTATVTITIN